MVNKHAYLNTLLLLHSAFMLCVVKMALKGEVGGCALNSHGNYIVDHVKSWKNHGILFCYFCGNHVAYMPPYIVSNTVCVFAGQVKSLMVIRTRKGNILFNKGM